MRKLHNFLSIVLSIEKKKFVMVMKILIIFFMLLGCLISHVVSGG